MSHLCSDCDGFIIRFLQVLTGSRDRRMAMRAECYLAVVDRRPESQAEIARKYGITRAAVSKIICQIKDELGIVGRYGQEKLTYKERLAKLRKAI